MSDITVAADTPMAEPENCSRDREKRSSSERNSVMPSGSGGSSRIIQDSKESTAPCSETKAHTKARLSFNRRIKLLMSSGLIAGITPTSTAKQSAQLTLDTAFSRLDGCDAARRKAA